MFKKEVECLPDKIMGEAVIMLLNEGGPITCAQLHLKLRSFMPLTEEIVREAAIQVAVRSVRTAILKCEGTIQSQASDML